MSDFVESSVTGSGAESGQASDTSVAATSAAESAQTTVPQSQPDAGLNLETGQQGEEGAATAPPPEAEKPVYDEVDPAQLADEKARQAFIAMRQGLKEMEAFKSSQEPVATWLQQRAQALGIDPSQPDAVQTVFEMTQTDIGLVDRMYSADDAVRREFHQTFYQQDPEAYQRFVGDIIADPNVQVNLLTQLGVDENDIPDLVNALSSGSWKEAVQTVQSDINEVTLSDLSDWPQLQEVYKSLPPHKRAIADSIYDRNQLADYVNEQARLQEVERRQIEWQRQQEQAKEAERRQQIQSRKKGAYDTVRGAVENALKAIFPHDPTGLKLVLSAAESELYSSPEGATLWNELEAMIETGQTREFQLKLPLMISKAKIMATEQAKYLSGQAEKARQFDELMRFGSAEEIMNYLNQVRGKQAVLKPGTQPVPNGRQMPQPKAAGQYERANVLALWPGDRTA